MLICTLESYGKVFGLGWALGIASVVIVLLVAAALESRK